MTWLFPSALAMAGVAAVATFVLHFIARSRPLAEPLPTARFVPQQPVYARARSIALSDLPLLLLRVAAILALGAGVAGPVFTSRGTVARIVMADRSRGVANVGDVRDSTRAYLRPGDELVVFDSASFRQSGFLDSLVPTGARGSLSVGLAAATRAAMRVAPKSDSVDLILVSPVAAEELDAATLQIRHSWPGRIRIVPVRASESPVIASHVEVIGSANDAIAAGMGLMGSGRAAGAVRVVRTRPSAADSAWAQGAGHIVLVWPEDPASVTWERRGSIDTIGAVATGTGALVATLPRVWTFSGRAVARWSDGEPAAVEHAVGDGCIRDIGILIDQSSDVTLRQTFRDFAAGFLAPCGGARATQPVAAATVASIEGKGGFAAAASLRDHATEVSRATPWLLALGALLLIAELAVRRTGRRLA